MHAWETKTIVASFRILCLSMTVLKTYLSIDRSLMHGCVQTPLPIRILIPVAYNTVRIGYLWQWAFLPYKLGGIGRAIAIANFTYWMTNLFGFLIPVAAVRYMRAHFFAVEAEEVTTRTSMEDSAGLMF